MKFPRLAAPFLLASCVFLTGCAAEPNHPAVAAREKPTLLPAPVNLPASKVATVTIYRPGESDVEDRHPTVALNGGDLVTIQSGRTFTARLLPGTYRFTVDDDKAGSLQAKAGEHYYFYMAIVPAGFGSQGRLGLVSPQQGKDQTAGLEPADKDDIENAAFR